MFIQQIFLDAYKVPGTALGILLSKNFNGMMKVGKIAIRPN